jgi:2-methylcitrate dehydratase PrpD
VTDLAEGPTVELARFAAEVKYSDLPSPVLDKIRLHVIDTIGATAIGSRQDWNRKLLAYASEQSRPGRSSVMNEASLFRPEWAAFVNATYAQGFETDDYHPSALLHPTCVSLASVMALGEELGSSGCDLLTAMAVATEVQVRIGMAGNPGINFGRRFHTTSTVGPFGSAAAGGWLLGLDPTTMISALSIAGSHAGGTVEYTQSGGSVKRMHAGLACIGGLRSAQLAQLGVTGPRTLLEGKAGFFQAYSAEYNVSRVTKDLGQKWELLDCSIKPYFANGLIQAPLGLLHQLRAQHRIDHSAVKAISVGVPRFAALATGAIGPRPVDMTGAQFSMQYSLALGMVACGNGYADYLAMRDLDFKDEAVAGLADRVNVYIDEEADALFPKAFLADVSITLKDNTVLQARGYAPGSPENPLSDEAVYEKFRRSYGAAAATGTSEEVEQAVAGLETAASAAELMSLLRSSA